MSKRSWIILAVVVVVFAAGITVGVTAFDNSSSPAAVTLEPAMSVGAHPFTSSVASNPVAISKNALTATAATRRTLTTNPKTHTLVATGTAPGLYGGSGNTHVCDPRQLVAYLQQNPDKATAWSGVLGVTTSKIASYVGALTPVLLTNDTLVTNHGFLNGHATALQSVLQAGTAVMVDASGTPRVKCNCGNPLTPPELITTARLRGTGWPGYTPTQVTVVNAGPVIKSFTLVNITTGATYTQPVGAGTTSPASPANGTARWVAAEFLPRQGGDTAIITSTDGHTWTRVTANAGIDVAGLAYGQGKWLALSTAVPNAGSKILASTDLRTWTPAAYLPDLLTGIAYGDGRWTATGRHSNSPALSSGVVPTSAVVYTSTDASNWTQVASTGGSPVSLGQAVAYGDGSWRSSLANVQGGSGAAGSTVELLTSQDGLHWTNTSTHFDGEYSWLTFGSGQWLLGANSGSGSAKPYYRSQNGNSWTPVSATGLGETSIGVAAYGNGTWLASGLLPTDPTENIAPGSAFFSSTDGRTWTRVAQVDVPIGALAYGPVPKADATPTTAPATTAPPTIPPPTTTPQTTAVSTAGAPCDQSLIQAAVGQNVSVHSVNCAGPWAAASATAGQDDVSLLFHWNGSVWEPADRATACASAALPKVNPFWQIACNSN